MGKLTPEIPFAELVERARQAARIDSDNDVYRARGAINDVYIRELPAKEDWAFLLIASALTCTDDYATGTVSVNTQATAATFSTDVTLDATFTGRRIKFSGNANVYDFTQTNATGGTISPPLSGNSNITSGTYTIFQDRYTLAEDFDRWPKNGGLLLYEGGQITPLVEVSPQEWYRDYSSTPGRPERCRLVTAGTDNIPRVEVNPPPDAPYVLGNEYIRRLEPLYDSTAGFVTIAAGATTATGSAGTTRFLEASTGWFIRVDAFGKGEDSEWYRLIAVTHNSSATLASAFGQTGGTTTLYTLSPAPQIPAKMHQLIFYGAMRQLLTDQNDPLYQFYQAKFTEALQDAQHLYKSRRYGQDVATILEEYHFRR